MELVDSQGNSVLKSSATPVIFNPTTNQENKPRIPSTVTNTTETYSTTITTTAAAATTATYTSTASKLPIPPYVTQGEDDKYRDHIWHTSSPSSSLKHGDLWGFLQDQTKDKSFHGPHERPRITTDEYLETYLKIKENLEISNNSLSHNISETKTLTRKERVYHVVVWCIGVVVGALLLLTLCSLVIWMLNRCRKSKHSEEHNEEELQANRGSFRTFNPQQNVRNQTTSWTFENFCSINRKSKLEPSRSDTVPVGIDNDSLMENYVFMLDTQPVGTFIKH